MAATLFTLATGQEPFPGKDLPELREMVRCGLPDPDPRCAGLLEALERLIPPGLAVAPGQRPELIRDQKQRVRIYIYWEGFSN